jgi:hypothetical protein
MVFPSVPIRWQVPTLSPLRVGALTVCANRADKAGFTLDDSLFVFELSYTTQLILDISNYFAP